MGIGGMIYGGGDVMDGKRTMGHDQPVDSMFSSAPSNSFLGSRAMVSFGAVGGANGSGSSYYLQNENGDEYLDEFYNQPEKKRRLTVDQVQFLEKSFEADNRLEPDRKILLAKELGLQPRQIGVWFQNRRARCKTKNLETDYETLSASYTSLKTDYDILLKENEKLKAEVLRIKQNGVVTYADNVTKTSSEMISEDEEYGVLVKGDATYVDNPWLINEIHSSFFESRDIPEGFEPDPSDLSQNEEFNMNAYSFQEGKIEDAYYHPHSSLCNYGYPVEDNASNFWSY